MMSESLSLSDSSCPFVAYHQSLNFATKRAVEAGDALPMFFCLLLWLAIDSLLHHCRLLYEHGGEYPA